MTITITFNRERETCKGPKRRFVKKKTSVPTRFKIRKKKYHYQHVVIAKTYKVHFAIFLCAGAKIRQKHIYISQRFVCYLTRKRY